MLNHFHQFDFFLLKKHYCPECGKQLAKRRVVRIIQQDTKEAQKYSVFKGISHGEVKLSEYDLECRSCNFVYPLKELKAIEKEKRRK